MKVFLKFILIIGVVLFYLAVQNAGAQDWLVVFAANLETSGDVYREDHSGADLYSVRFNPESKKVSELTQLTFYENASEWFPSLSPDTKWIAYNYEKQGRQDVRLLNRMTGDEIVIFPGGRFPEWISNSELLISNSIRGTKDIYRVILDFTGATPIIKSTQRLTNRTRCPGTCLAQDAYPFPDGQHIAFHILRDSGQPGAAIAVMDIDGTNFQRITEWNGSGHGIVNSTGQEIICSVSGSGIPRVLGLYANPITVKSIYLPTYEFWTHDSSGTVYAVGQYKNSRQGAIELAEL